ncbi:PLAC8 family-domain-containing protein [Leucosporidium creatinivorum]|uniref:PLAC8 family-domain-containing protein n=1 Tax=Leucosporidium creatinivorum TaxID=106004 RepID=A0A1Y2G0Q7_9BASI|nr:PLAC8 family-domain-containing protein [Leucosporidium creatinivorum]
MAYDPSQSAAPQKVEQPSPLQAMNSTISGTTMGQPHQVQSQHVGPGGEFSTGLCACDIGPFCVSCWCPCITYGENKQRYDSLNLRGQAVPKEQVEGCGSHTLVYAAIQCVTGWGFVLDFLLRGEVRNRYHIAGSAGSDFCTSCCCTPCSLQQQSREIALEEAGQWGAQGVAGGQGKAQA